MANKHEKWNTKKKRPEHLSRFNLHPKDRTKQPSYMRILKSKSSKVVSRSASALRPSLLALAVSQMLALPVTDAATIDVTTASTNPSSGCTLTEAIITANTDLNTGGCFRSGSATNDTIDLLVKRTITFSAGFDGEPGNDGTATPFVGSNITIQGRGSTIERDVSAADFRLLTVFSRDAEGYQGQLTLKDLTIQNGNTQYNGGAIYVLGELNLDNTTVNSNTSRNPISAQGGGAIFVRGSENTFTILNSTVTVTNSTISGNTALNGGGILAEAGTTATIKNSTVSGNSAVEGGGILATMGGHVSVSNSTVSGNSATNGGGLVATQASSLTLINSTTVSGNSASRDGGGIFARSNSSVNLINSTVSGNSASRGGGGILSFGDSSVSLNNSTIAGNTATDGGGVYADSFSGVSSNNSTVSRNSARRGGGINVRFGSSVRLNNSTVSGNSAILGGGIVVAEGGGLIIGSSAFLTNSILANSYGGDCNVDPDSYIMANEHNIIEDGSCGTDTLSVDPLLGPLQDNGGRTQTHALLAGSPAINAGLNSNCNAAPISRLDQRGYLRTGVCDIGAFEFGASLPPPPPPPPFEPATIVPSVNLLLDDDDLND